LDDAISANIKGVYGGYKSVYKSALHGAQQGKDLLCRLIQLCNDMVLGGVMDHQLLNKYGFNRWKADGTAMD
jgi:hypothetical protein